MKSYRLAGLLILAVALAGFSSAAASPDKDCKPVGACQAQSACAKSSEGDCALSAQASSPACETKCASACAGPCESADCGDCTACASTAGYRGIRSRESRCTCGSVACRLYGIRCKADKRPLGQACRAGARTATCPPGCTKRCCAAVNVSMKKPPCPPGCTKPCAAGGERKVTRIRQARCKCGGVACRLYGIRCKADKRPLGQACRAGARTATCPPGCTKRCCAAMNVSMKKPPCPPGCTKPCCADGERKVMKISIGETGSCGERIIIKKMDSDSDEDLRWLDEEGEIIHISTGPSAFLGVSVESVPQSQNGGSGVLISEVHEGSPAEDRGLAAGDIILAVDGVDVQGPEDFVQEIRAREPGDEVTLEVVRDGRAMELAVELGERETLEMKKAAPTVTQIEKEIRKLERDLKKLREKLKEMERN